MESCLKDITTVTVFNISKDGESIPASGLIELAFAGAHQDGTHFIEMKCSLAQHWIRLTNLSRMEVAYELERLDLLPVVPTKTSPPRL